MQQQRAKETSKFKIQETSRLSVRKQYAQNKGQHLDKDANRQRPPQAKQETTRPGETSKFKNKETSVLSPNKHKTKPQHLIKTQTDMKLTKRKRHKQHTTVKKKSQQTTDQKKKTQTAPKHTDKNKNRQTCNKQSQRPTEAYKKLNTTKENKKNK